MKGLLALALAFAQLCVVASCTGSIDSAAAGGSGTSGGDGAAGGPDMTWCLVSEGTARAPYPAIEYDARVCDPDQICALGGGINLNSFGCCDPSVDPDCADPYPSASVYCDPAVGWLRVTAGDPTHGSMCKSNEVCAQHDSTDCTFICCDVSADPDCGVPLQQCAFDTSG